jgi:hypothetical protein
MPTPFTKDELEKITKSKEVANNIAGYLNAMEEICSSPMSEQEKAESFNQMALYVGKTMVAFTNLCDLLDIYAERGARGGVIRKSSKNLEDDYEFQEA